MSTIAAPAFLALLQVLASPRVDVGAFAGASVGGGYLPVDIDVEPASPAVEVSADLRGGVRFVDDGYSLVLRAGPRVYAQAPNAFSVDRPLLYLTTDLGYQVALSRRVAFSLTARAGAGEMSYTTLVSVFEPGTSPLDATVIPIVTYGMSAGLTYQHTRRHTLGFSFGATHQQTFYAIAPEGADEVLESTDSTSWAATSSHVLTPADQLAVAATCLLFSGATTAQSIVPGATATWTRRLSPRDLLTTSGGMDVLLEPELGTVRPIPSFSFGYGHQLEYWALDASLGVRAFFDRIALVYTPQSFASVGATRRWSPDFSSRASLFFSASLLDHESVDTIFGTTVGADLPSSYSLSRTFALTFGARATLSGPPLWAVDSSSSAQAQGTLYVGGTFVDGTGPGRGSFVSQ